MSVAIIGGGVAGLTACLYLARAGISPYHYVGDENQGGLLTKTSIVENYPGFPDGILGYDLIENMEKQCAEYPVKRYESKVLHVDHVGDVFTVHDSHGNAHTHKAIIIATGSTPRRLGLAGEDDLWAHGISSCAVCDGALYKRKKIVVVGGGDTACEEALFLTKFSDVTLIHRRGALRASKIMAQRVLNHPKITILWNHVVVELIDSVTSYDGSKRVLIAVVIEDVNSHERKEMLVDGLFYGLGLVPNSFEFTNLVPMDSDGFIIKLPDSSKTCTPGVFVAGDVADRRYKQAITAAGSGCMAALDALEYLSE